MEFKVGDRVESQVERNCNTGEKIFGILVAQRPNSDENFLLERLDGGGNIYSNYHGYAPVIRGVRGRKFWSVYVGDLELLPPESKYPQIKTKFLEGYPL